MEKRDESLPGWNVTIFLRLKSSMYQRQLDIPKSHRVPLVLSGHGIRLGWEAYSCTTLMDQFHLVLTPNEAKVRASRGKGSKGWYPLLKDLRVWDVSIDPHYEQTRRKSYLMRQERDR